MFITLKRKSMIAVSILVALIAVVSIVISQVSNSVYAVPKIGKTVVIDAGHGGRDGGVSGIHTKTKESDINLTIAKKLKHFLLSSGYDVVMTRNNTDGLYGISSKNKKLDDMEKRKQIIEKAKPDLVVSIHQNFFPRGIVRGAQVFYAPGSEEGRAGAATMQNVLNINLEATNKVPMKGDYFIIQCSQYLSLLIECGFLSNAEDERLLVSAEYQDKVAYSIFAGINQILLPQAAEPPPAA